MWTFFLSYAEYNRAADSMAAVGKKLDLEEKGKFIIQIYVLFLRILSE